MLIVSTAKVYMPVGRLIGGSPVRGYDRCSLCPFSCCCQRFMLVADFSGSRWCGKIFNY